jgi:hypothetical protein
MQKRLWIGNVSLSFDAHTDLMGTKDARKPPFAASGSFKVK